MRPFWRPANLFPVHERPYDNFPVNAEEPGSMPGGPYSSYEIPAAREFGAWELPEPPSWEPPEPPSATQPEPELVDGTYQATEADLAEIGAAVEQAQGGVNSLTPGLDSVVEDTSEMELWEMSRSSN